MLYIVSTPIGNLEDITIRAIKILRSVDYIFAEDTRNIKKLLTKFKIKGKKIDSLHKFNEKQKIDRIINYLKQDMDIAIVSDAGTPLLSDPGVNIVNSCFNNNLKITPIPGVSALTTLLSITPFENNEFIFVGFLEKKIKKKLIQLKNLIETNKNIFFFESPNRVMDTFKIIKDIDENLKIIVGRELTKKFEEIIFDKIENIIEHFNENNPIGEFTIGIHNTYNKDSKKEYLNDIEILRNLNIGKKDIIEFITKKYKISKNKIYEILKNE